ncbi:MAG: YihY/virulence factor BrkB family protein [Gammaproteobacteria bacterium]
MWQKILDKLTQLQDWANNLPYIGVLVRASVSGRDDFTKDMAASIAYYTFLSLFPLMLGLVAIGGFFLESTEIQQHVNNLVVDLLPVSGELVNRHIESLIRIRGAAGLTSVIVLMWAASKMMGALSRAINRSLGLERPDAFYFSSLRYFVWTLVVTLVVFVTMALAPMVELLIELELEVIGERWNAFLKIIGGHTAGVLQTAFLTGAMYAFLPYQRLPWSTLLPGIVVTTVLIEVGKGLFSLYVGAASHYDSVYGSLSSIIVLMLWLYFMARVVLYGAEVIRANR